MAIGRTDERQNPLIPVAETCRRVVWMSLADPIWASGHRLASKAGHMTAFEPWPMSRKPLEPYGPSTHGIIASVAVAPWILSLSHIARPVSAFATEPSRTVLAEPLGCAKARRHVHIADRDRPRHRLPAGRHRMAAARREAAARRQETPIRRHAGNGIESLAASQAVQGRRQ